MIDYPYFLKDTKPKPCPMTAEAKKRRAELRKRLLLEGKISENQTIAHHKCPTWRYFDWERYLAYNEEDIEFVTQAEHSKIHMDWQKREQDYCFLTQLFLPYIEESV